MTKWAKVKDGEVINVGPLPAGFNKFTDDEKNLRGVYRVVEDPTDVKPWQTYTSSYSFENDNVYETKTITDIPLEEFKQKKYDSLRNEAKRYILSKYPEYKQLSALAGFYPDPENQEIKDGVKYYFDIARNMKDDLFAYTTYEDVEAVYFRTVTLNDETQEIISEKFWGE